MQYVLKRTENRFLAFEVEATSFHWARLSSLREAYGMGARNLPAHLLKEGFGEIVDWSIGSVTQQREK